MRTPRALSSARLLTRLDLQTPLLHRLVTRAMRRRFDALAPRWDAIRGQHADSTRALLAALDALEVGSARRILDVGTGTGQAASVLKERYRGATIDAIDASPRMIELARAKPALAGIRFTVADGSHLPIEDDMIDLAVSLLVQPFPEELLRVLAPGGWAVFVYPMGPDTPIWFPASLVRPHLERAGYAEVRSGLVGAGEWTAGRKDG